MNHHQITRVLYVALMAVILSAGFVFFSFSQILPASADGIQPFLQYSGYVDSVVTGGPGCPVYTLVTNNDLTDGMPPEFGIFIPPTPPGLIYDDNNLATPGTPLIGGVAPLPDLLCIAPVPVYPLFYDLPDGGFYLTGTGGIPGQ